MAEYSRSIDIPASADSVFAFVSDVSNFPRYVPTTRRAEADLGHVRVEGVSHGERYEDEGHIHVDSERRVMRWGSGASGYRGELLVSEAGSGGAQIEINLHFSDAAEQAPSPQQVNESLDQSLERLREELMR